MAEQNEIQAPVATDPHGRPPWWAFLLIALLITPFCFLGLPGTDSDAFYHLSAGRWMHEHGRVLDSETFSFTIPGRPWINYYWAFEWLLFAIYRRAGLTGLFLLRGSVILLTVSLFLLLVHRRTGGARLETVAFGLLVLPVYALRSINLRPHLFSYLFLVAALLLADAFGRRRRWAGAALVGLCVLWANLHGVEYPVFLAVLLVHFADALRPHLRQPFPELLHDAGVRRWSALLAACAMAFLVNPFGWRLLLTPRIGTDEEVMSQITEMVAPPLSSFFQLAPALDLSSWAPLRLAALAGVALLPVLVRTGQFRNAVLFLLGLALVLDKSRFLSEFILLAVPSVAAAVATARRMRPARAWPRYVLLAVSVHVAASAAVTFRDKARAGGFEPVLTTRFPVGAVAYLEQSGFSGNLVADPTFAGYATWRLYPRARVLMDMRTPEPFGAQQLWLFWAIGEEIPIERAERQWPIGAVLLPRNHRLAARYRANPGFAPVYAESEYIVFARAREGEDGLAGRRLTTLPLMEALEAGQDPPAPPSEALRLEAERLVAAWPGNDFAQRTLLWLLLQEGRAAEAQARSDMLARQFPRRSTFPYYSGLAFRRLDRPAEAVVRFRRTTDLAPGFFPAQAALADALLALDRTEEALKVMESATWGIWGTLSNRDYILLGRLRLRTGRWHPAVDAFERALWLLDPSDPRRPDVENDLAVARLGEGDVAGALAAIDEALAQRPAFPLALFNRARALRGAGRAVESRALLDRLAADPDLPPSVRAAVEAESRR